MEVKLFQVALINCCTWCWCRKWKSITSFIR